jgi:hypothetical protein
MAKQNEPEPLFTDTELSAKRYELLTSASELLSDTKDQVYELCMYLGRPRPEFVSLSRQFNRWYDEFRALMLSGSNDDFVRKVIQKEREIIQERQEREAKDGK